MSVEDPSQMVSYLFESGIVDELPFKPFVAVSSLNPKLVIANEPQKVWDYIPPYLAVLRSIARDFLKNRTKFKANVFDINGFYAEDFLSRTKKLWVRQEVGTRLELAAQALQEEKGPDCRLMVTDAWRSTEEQAFLFQSAAERIHACNPNSYFRDIFLETSKFVSPPSSDQMYPSFHTTGGAVDVAVYVGNEKLPMAPAGTTVYSPQAKTDYYEKFGGTGELFYHQNRLVLKSAMEKAGFVNYWNEFWHYSYGDQIWSQATGNPIVFGAGNPRWEEGEFGLNSIDPRFMQFIPLSITDFGELTYDQIRQNRVQSRKYIPLSVHTISTHKP